MKSAQINRAGPLIVLFMLVLLTSCFFNDPFSIGDWDYEASEPFEYEVSIENQGCFRIRGINGSIEITGKADSTTVEIWGEKIVKSESIADAEAHLDDLKIVVSSAQNEVFVRTEQPRDTNGRNYQVEYHVRIPESWQVWVENTNGEVDVDSLNNFVFVGLINGDVCLSDVEGNLGIGVTNGNIGLSNVVGSLDAGVINGRIFGDIALPPQGVCKLGTTNGDIDLEIPESTSAGFSARVTNGNIRVSNLVLRNLSTTKTSTMGILGDGNGTITLCTVNGQIDVRGF